jgi:hypothetical protein
VKATILKFPSFVYLTAFRKYSKAKHWEINISDLTVLCDCSEKEAGFACNDFSATVVAASELAAPQAKSWDIGSTQFAFSRSTQ